MPFNYISEKDCPRNYGVELNMEILLKKSHFLIPLCGFSLCGFPWQMAMSLTTEAAWCLLFSVMGSQQTQPGSLSETESPVSLCRFGSKGAFLCLWESPQSSAWQWSSLRMDVRQTHRVLPHQPAPAPSFGAVCRREEEGCDASGLDYSSARRAVLPGYFSSELWRKGRGKRKEGRGRSEAETFVGCVTTCFNKFKQKRKRNCCGFGHFQWHWEHCLWDGFIAPAMNEGQEGSPSEGALLMV